MNENLHNLETIRQYLLGKISDETILEGVEELLFSDEEFCNKTEIVEDELINDFIFGKLNAEDNLSFEKTLENNADRRAKVKVTQLLKEKVQTVGAEEKVSFFDSIKAFFRQPIYAGGFALLLVAILIGVILLSRSPNNPELVEFKNIYKDNRPFETRISDFDYAPFQVTRGKEEYSESQKRKLKIIENELLKKVDSSPNAINHNTLGIFYLSQNQYSEAVKELEEAAKLEPNNAQFQNDLGSGYFEKGKNGDREKKFQLLSQANEKFSKALELDPKLLPALFNKSLYLQENQLFNEAKKSWELYLQKDSASKWADEARKNLEKISQTQSGLNKTKDDILNDFLSAYRQNDEKTILKIHNSTKGLINNLSLAEQLTNRYLNARIKEDTPSAQEYLGALTYLAETEKKNNSDFFFSDLVDYYTKLEKSKLNELKFAKKTLSNGFTLVSERDTVKAKVNFDESKIIFKNIGNEIEANIAEQLSSQMIIYDGKLQESSDRMNALLEVTRKKNYKSLSANLFYYLGMCSFRKGEFSQAIKVVNNSIQLSQEINNLFQIKYSSELLSATYTELSETPKSLEMLHLQNNPNEFYFFLASHIRSTLRLTSSLLSKTEYLQTATDFGNEVVELSKISNKTGELNESLYYLTNALTKNNKFEKALEVANNSIEIAQNLEPTKLNQKILADAYQTRADIFGKINRCQDALADYQKSLDFYKNENEVSYNSFELERGKLLCFKQLDQNIEFQTSLERLLKLSEKVRQNVKEDSLRQSYFENEQTVLDLAIENAINQNSKEKAFEYSETLKSRSLLDFITSEKSIKEVENEFGIISKPLSLKKIQSRIPQNIQIVEYSVLPKKLIIWIVTKNSFEQIEKSIEYEELRAEINNYQNLLKQKGDLNSINIISKKLYELLIPATLEKDKILFFIPDKSIYQIPFASLISPKENYLIEDFAILNSPSSSVLVALTENSQRKQIEETLLAVGNPSFDRQANPRLADLPDAEIEAKEITRNYQNTKVFTAQEATKQNFFGKLSTSEIIHFAGHFVVNEESLNKSKMTFADSDLYAFELFNFKLPNTKLVILSACQTGLEKLNKSEGSIGIARTFLAMGAPLVAASNWKVDSEATKNLMISFHQKRKIGKLSSIEALRQAQLEMLQTKDFSHPNYWSAFSLSGGYTEY